jgi:protein gp37
MDGRISDSSLLDLEMKQTLETTGSGTEIAWADETLNFAAGCTKCATECANCYVPSMSARLASGLSKNRAVIDLYTGVSTDNDFTGKLNWSRGLMDKALAEIKASKKPKRWFLYSMSDPFHGQADPDMQGELAWFVNMVSGLSIKHVLYLLTKRPGNMVRWQQRYFPSGLPACVWPGTTCGHSKSYWRVEELLRIEAHGPKWISAEPLLEPLDFSPFFPDIQWIVPGGESGRGARRCVPDWIYQIIVQCKRNNVPVFVKQIGSHWAKSGQRGHPKGGDPVEWPPYLQIREFPK